MMKGAGVRCFKHRAGMPVLGIVGKMMNTRFNGGVLPLLDTWIRKVAPDQAQGGTSIGPITPGTATRIPPSRGGTARRIAMSTCRTCVSAS